MQADDRAPAACGTVECWFLMHEADSGSTDGHLRREIRPRDVRHPSWSLRTNSIQVGLAEAICALTLGDGQRLTSTPVLFCLSDEPVPPLTGEQAGDVPNPRVDDIA